jgi:hypothetical protein
LLVKEFVKYIIIMKRIVTMTALMLLILAVGDGCHNARHDRRGIKNFSGTAGISNNFRRNRRLYAASDSTGTMFMNHGMGQGQMPFSGRYMNHRFMYGMRGGIGRGLGYGTLRPGLGYGMMRNMQPGTGYGMMGGIQPGMGYGMMGGMRPGMGYGMMGGIQPGTGYGLMLGMGPGMRLLERIPNLTDKQKKDIEEIAKHQRDEVIKLSDEMNAKMQAIRDSGKKSILNVLSDDQKKTVESWLWN